MLRIKAFSETLLPVFEFRVFNLRMSNPRIERGDITTHNVNLLKLINQKVFPVNYNVR